MQYLGLGLAWVIICVLIGLFIRYKGVASASVKIGLVSIFVSYLFGLGILLYAILH